MSMNRSPNISESSTSDKSSNKELVTIKAIKRDIRFAITKMVGKRIPGGYGYQGKLFKLVSDSIEYSQSLNDLIDAFYNVLKKCKFLTAARRTAFFQSDHLVTVPLIRELIEKASGQIISNLEAIKEDKNDFRVCVTHTDFVSQLKSYLEVNFDRIVDNRKIDNEEKDIRRLDSLARLFSLNPSSSICAAVTFQDGELIIAANLSDLDESKKVEGCLHDRTKLLIGYLKELSGLNFREISDEDLAHTIAKLSSSFSEKFMEIAKTTLPIELVMQAIFKLSYTVFLDNSLELEDTFNDSVKGNLLSNFSKYRILLPALNDKNELCVNSISAVMVPEGMAKDGEDFISRKLFPIDGIKAHGVTGAHAEQLIAYYLFKLKKSQGFYNNENPLKIGVSKLCCQTCYDNFGGLPIKVRGCHGQVYDKALNLMAAPEAATAKTSQVQLRAETSAHNSPPDSPVKLRRSEFMAKTSPIDPTTPVAQASPTGVSMRLFDRLTKVSEKVIAAADSNLKKEW